MPLLASRQRFFMNHCPAVSRCTTYSLCLYGCLHPIMNERTPTFVEQKDGDFLYSKVGSAQRNSTQQQVQHRHLRVCAGTSRRFREKCISAIMSPSICRIPTSVPYHAEVPAIMPDTRIQESVSRGLSSPSQLDMDPQGLTSG